MSHLNDAVLAVGRLLYRALGMEEPPPRLTEAEVLQIARATADQQGWPWTEPATVGFTPGSGRKPGQWRVFTGADGMGGNITIRINDETGTVLNKGFAQR